MTETMKGGDHDDEKRQQTNHKVSFHNGNKKGGRKPLFCSYCKLDSVLWLRRIALDPCEIGASLEDSRKSFDHILNMKKFMNSMETPRRKRKLDHFLNESTKQIGSKLMKEHLSVHHSRPYLLNLADSGESSNRKVVEDLHSYGSVVTYEEYSVTEKPMNFVKPSIKSTFHLVDSDESVNGLLNPLIPDNPDRKSKPLMDADDSDQSSYSHPFAEPNYLRFPRLAVPIGPRFQAEVPTYTYDNEKIKRYIDDSETLRWSGTRVWPVVSSRTDKCSEKVGKGRPESCKCKSPGSLDCIKNHVLEKRLDLQAKLGGAFLTWKFDDMGEEVSKSWTFIEQKRFSIMRQRHMDDEATFWAQALKCLPFKCKNSILSYYFNVFIPKRLSIETKLSSKRVYSDDEEAEEDDDGGDDGKRASRKRCKAKSDGSRKCKDVKKRYMRHAH